MISFYSKVAIRYLNNYMIFGKKIKVNKSKIVNVA